MQTFSWRKAIAIVSVLTWSQAAVAQAVELQPAGDWQLRSGDEFCRISRDFGPSDDRVTLYIYSYGPIGAYQVTLVGAGLPKNREKARLAKVGFGDEAEAKDTLVIVGQYGDAGAITFRAAADRVAYRFVRTWEAPTRDSADVNIPSTATRLLVDNADMEPRTLALGPLPPVFEKLHTCDAGLLETWDTGAVEMERLGALPKLANGQDVVEAIYWPSPLMINRVSLFLQIRMTVGVDGKAEDCVLQAPSWRGKDRRDVCRAFEDVARFEPATDRDGEPVPALFRASYLMFRFD